MGHCGNDLVFSDNMNDDTMKKWFKAFHRMYLELYTVQPTNSNELPTVRNPNDFVRGNFTSTSTAIQMQGSRCNRQVDIFVEHSDNPDSWGYHWRDVRVVGEFIKAADKKSLNSTSSCCMCVKYFTLSHCVDSSMDLSCTRGTLFYALSTGQERIALVKLT